MPKLGILASASQEPRGRCYTWGWGYRQIPSAPPVALGIVLHGSRTAIKPFSSRGGMAKGMLGFGGPWPLVCHPSLSSPMMRMFPGTGQEAEAVCLHVIQGPKGEGSEGGVLPLKRAGGRKGTFWRGSPGARRPQTVPESRGEGQFLALVENSSHLHPPLAPHLHASSAPELEGSANVRKVPAWA